MKIKALFSDKRYTTAALLLAGGAALTLGSVNAASGTVIQVDFNDVSTDPGAGWNVISNPQTIQSGTALTDANDNPTAATLGIAGAYTFKNKSNSTDTSTAFTGGDFAEAELDYAYFGGGNKDETATGTITFSGLNANTGYTLEVVSARNTSADHRTEDVTVNGDYTTNPVSSDDFNAYDDGAQAGNILVFDANSGASGQLDLTFSVDNLDADHEFSYVNAVRLTGPVAVPEPASLALMGLGGLAMLGRRRRRGVKA